MRSSVNITAVTTAPDVNSGIPKANGSRNEMLFSCFLKGFVNPKPEKISQSISKLNKIK